jgi:hypothetical protein
MCRIEARRYDGRQCSLSTLTFVDGAARLISSNIDMADAARVLFLCTHNSARLPPGQRRLPTFPCGQRRLHWSFPDPASAQGDEETRWAAFRDVRDQIEARIATFLASPAEVEA